MSQRIYNNFGIYSVGMLASLNVSKTLSLPELLLIAPFITHSQLLAYLARKNIEVKSLEQLIVKNSTWFANFNERYYSGITGSLNAVQFLHDIEVVEWDGHSCSLREMIPYDRAMGSRAEKIFNASENIVRVICGDVANSYWGEKGDGKEEGILKTGDGDKIRKAFELLDTFVAKVLKDYGSSFQMIVLEHVPPDYWAGSSHIHLVEQFVGGNALIRPEDISNTEEEETEG